MKLQQLRYFASACRLGGISRAAESLHVAQPTVSMAIRELEREFGVALIAQRYQGFALTEEGETLRELSESLLRHADHVCDQMGRLGQRRRPVRLGIPPMIGTVVLPLLFPELDRTCPGVVIATEELGTNALVRELRENALDLAFVNHALALPPELEALPVAVMEVVWCATAAHPLTNRSAVSARALEGEPLVLFQNSFALRELTLRQFEAAGVTPRIFHTTGQLSTVQSLIRGGNATGFLLRPFADTMPDVAARPLDPPITVQVSLARRRGQTLQRDAARLAEACRRIRIP